MDPITETEAATVAALARTAVAPLNLADVSSTGLLVFPDKTIRSLEAFAHMPKRKRAGVSLYEAKSFIDYIKAHKVSESTHLFGMANELGGSFTAVIDYHQKIGATTDQVGQAGWGDHRAVLNLCTTPEWKRWVESNGKAMTQEAFAEFLEDNVTDIINPDGATLIEIAQLLVGKKGATFRSGKNLKTGAIDFQYSEQIEAQAGRRDDTMQVPDRFTLGICPFVGAHGVEVSVRLRFRISDSGKLTFIYLLDRPHKIIEAAFNATRAEIETATELSVHLGTAQINNPTA